jgi:hypothetical protein
MFDEDVLGVARELLDDSPTLLPGREPLEDTTPDRCARLLRDDASENSDTLDVCRNFAVAFARLHCG